MTKRYLAIIYALTINISAVLFAVPAVSHPIQITHPDGTTQTVLLHGDEHFSYYTDLSGNLLKKNHFGKFVISDNPLPRQITPKKTTHIQSNFPTKGEVRSVVLLVNFKDVKFQIANPQQAFSNLLNQTNYSENGATGSARDYFIASSAGQFIPQFDVYGPFDLPNAMEYYGANTGNNHSIRADEMIKNACALAEAQGVNFAEYDLNQDGVIDNIFVYYAGYNEAEGGAEETIWPHRSYIINSPKYSGKVIRDYACTSELQNNTGQKMCGIGTFCHEFGHVLGLPDMYNTSNNSGSSIYTVGTWDIMCRGSYNNDSRTPPVYTAFERFMLDWLQPEQLSEIRNYELLPLETHNTAYMLADTVFNGNNYAPQPNEYFLLENRQRLGWDSVYNEKVKDLENNPLSAIPGEGMLITHITFSGRYDSNTFNDYYPLGFDIVEASGKNPSRSTSDDTYPGTLGITDWLPTLNDGTVLQQQLVSNITQETDRTITFHYGLADGVGFSFSPQNLPIFTSTYDRRVIDQQTQEITITGKGIPTDSIIISTNNTLFDIYINGEWNNNFRQIKDKVQDDSTYSRTILLRHRPVRQNCAFTTTTLRVSDEHNSIFNRITLTGTSPRPTYITPVVSLPATDITPYAFQINWQQQADAEYYYLTLYTLLDQDYSYLESFENFDDPDSIIAQGWTTIDATAYHNLHSDGNTSLSLNVPNSFAASPVYPSAVKELSFWLSNNYELNTTPPNGSLLLQAATENQQWQDIENIPILITTKNTKKTYSFNVNQGYRQFRLVNKNSSDENQILIDAFNVTTAQTPDYIFDPNGHLILAPDTTFSLSGVQPNTTYYYYVRCSESKGCTPHSTNALNTITTTTIQGNSKSNELTIVQLADGTLKAYLPFNGDGNSQLAIYNTMGQMLTAIDILKGDNSVTIPTQILNHNNIYIAKYIVPNKRINRQQYHAKFKF